MTLKYEVAFLPGIRNGKNGTKPITYHVKYSHLRSALCGKQPVSHEFMDAPNESESNINCPKCKEALESRKKYLNLQRKSV